VLLCAVLNELCILYTKLGFDRVLKRSLSAHWMQVKLFLSLLIWTADCMQFLSETHLHRCQIFGQFRFNPVFFYPNLNFGLLHTPLVICEANKLMRKTVDRQLELNATKQKELFRVICQKPCLSKLQRWTIRCLLGDFDSAPCTYYCLLWMVVLKKLLKITETRVFD